MELIHCTYQDHAEAILSILNESIIHSTAVYDYQPRPLSSMAPWFAAKQAHDFPVIGARSDAGHLLGFATYGTFRAWPAYKYTAELSLYVEPSSRGQGVGDRLLAELIRVAAERQLHVLIGGIDASNAVSMALHRKHGFSHCGTVRQCGFKFGQWLDLAFYPLVLKTPADPVDG
ncbi:MAG: GNAT family N-acetyltransferase [Burkholderiaceae bacterium]|jgi:phosphinothricin acetyltransferase|nr:GNAT family N-acetyltransferase [Burkholderiaceae bacterium]